MRISKKLRKVRSEILKNEEELKNVELRILPFREEINSCRETPDEEAKRMVEHKEKKIVQLRIYDKLIATLKNENLNRTNNVFPDNFIIEKHRKAQNVRFIWINQNRQFKFFVILNLDQEKSTGEILNNLYSLQLDEYLNNLISNFSELTSDLTNKLFIEIQKSTIHYVYQYIPCILGIVDSKSKKLIISNNRYPYYIVKDGVVKKIKRSLSKETHTYTFSKVFQFYFFNSIFKTKSRKGFIESFKDFSNKDQKQYIEEYLKKQSYKVSELFIVGLNLS